MLLYHQENRGDNQRNTTFEREIIPEEDEEKERDGADSNRMSKEEFKLNANFVCLFLSARQLNYFYTAFNIFEYLLEYYYS